MKVNELRIGNFILLNNEVDYITGIWCQFNGGNIDDYFVQNSGKMDYLLSEIEPILLTEEWLLKFGFSKEKHIMAYMLLTLPNDKSYKPWFYYDYETLSLIDSDTERTIVEIKYVHQLQNLYFALTGLEFEIK